MPTLTLLPPGPRAPAAGLHPDRVGLGALARSEANPTGRPPSALSVFPSLGRTGDGGSRDRGPGAGGPGGPGRPFPSHFQRKGNEMCLPTRNEAQPHGTQDWEVQQASPGQCRCESQDSVPPDREEWGRRCQRVRAGGRGGDEERAPGTGTNVRTQHSARTALSKYGRNKQTNDKK